MSGNDPRWIADQLRSFAPHEQSSAMLVAGADTILALLSELDAARRGAKEETT